MLTPQLWKETDHNHGEGTNQSVSDCQSSEAQRRNSPEFPVKRHHRCKTKTPKMQKKFFEYDRRQVLCKASQGEPKIKAALNLAETVRSLQQLLSSSSYFLYRRLNWDLAMTNEHIKRRLQRAGRFISKGDIFWTHVVFSDEKRLNLDSSGRLATYWHDLRNELHSFQTRQNKGVLSWLVSQLLYMDRHRSSLFQINRILTVLWDFWNRNSTVSGRSTRWNNQMNFRTGWCKYLQVTRNAFFFIPASEK